MSSYVRFEKRTGDRPKLSELSPEIASIDGGRNLFQYFDDCFDTSGFEVNDSADGGALAPVKGNGGVIQLTGDADSGTMSLPSPFAFSSTFVGTIKWSCRLRVVDAGSAGGNRVHIGLFSDVSTVSAPDRTFVKLISFNSTPGPSVTRKIGALVDFGQSSGFPNEEIETSSFTELDGKEELFHVYSQEISFDGTNIKTLTSVDGRVIFDQTSTQADAGTGGMKWAIIGTATNSQPGMLNMKVDLDWLSIVGTRDV